MGETTKELQVTERVEMTEESVWNSLIIIPFKHCVIILAYVDKTITIL